jgi:hypothetical protein
MGGRYVREFPWEAIRFLYWEKVGLGVSKNKRIP